MTATTGDEYDGPSPVHCHRGLPVATSNAVSAPLFFPPMCAITTPLSTSGDIAVPYSAGDGGAGVRQSTLPVLRSSAESTPVIPYVKTRLPDIVGVDFGPGPWARAAAFGM